MIDSRTLERIGAAKQKARNVRLSGTAERLGALHEQLEGFKALPDGLRERKAQWALAKLEDTEKTLKREAKLAEKKDAPAEHDLQILQMRVYGRIVQLSSLVGILFAGSAGLRGMAANPDITSAQTLTFTGLIIVAGALAWKAVGALFSGSSFDDSVKTIRQAMAECRDGLTKNV